MPPSFPSMPSLQLRSPQGAGVEISPYGAHVLSWVTPDGVEQLFLSPKAEFSPGAAIRGGVPVIFPQFADQGSLPKHGFARTQTWEVARSSADSAVFWLSENEATRQIWPPRFLAEYSVKLIENRLEMALAITNIDILPFKFSAALHTYLRVQDARRARLSGLQGLQFDDSASGQKGLREDAQQLLFDGEVDRVYRAVTAPLTLEAGDRRLEIRADGFPDAVVWNPGPLKCARLADMEPDGWLHFVCVEAALVARPLVLQPGGIWRGAQILSA